MMLRGGLTLVAAGFVAVAPIAFWGTRLAAAAIVNVSGGRRAVVAAAARPCSWWRRWRR